jgi:chemotaxis protein MotB
MSHGAHDRRRRGGAGGDHAGGDERWLLTYADMITLLMALFMVLFSIAVVNKGKFDELAKSLREAFAGPLDRGGTAVLNVGSDNPTAVAKSELNTRPASFPSVEQARQNQAGVAAAVLKLATGREQAQDKSLVKAKAIIDKRVAALGLQSQVKTEINERGLVIRLLTDKILFGLGSTTVQPQIVPLLGTIGAAIDPIPNPIRIEGHTDRVQYPGDPFGNWRLSVLRAVSVLEVLGTHGLVMAHHEDVAPDGFGDTHPLVAYGSGPAEPRNRRVEIVVLRKPFIADAQKAAAGPLGPDPTGVQQAEIPPLIAPGH